MGTNKCLFKVTKFWSGFLAIDMDTNLIMLSLLLIKKNHFHLNEQLYLEVTYPMPNVGVNE